MLLKMFTVFDGAAQAHLKPFFLPTSQMAERTFSDAVNHEDHDMSRHPADYTLFELGLFDEVKAEVLMHDAPKNLGNGVVFLRPQSVPELDGVNPNEQSGNGQATIGDESPVQSDSERPDTA